MSNSAAKNSVLTLRYATEFQCIGEACPDDCCSHGWKIFVEKRAYQNLRKLYQKTPDGRKIFQNSISRIKDRKTEQGYAEIQMKPNGDCPFLDEQRLCDIHKQFGGKQLGWICKDYPRTVSENFDQVELSLTLSCPEAARLCLSSEGATDLVEAPWNIIEGTSKYRAKLPSGNTLKPYFEYRNEIRQVLLHLAQADKYTTSGRVYLMLHFANRIGGFFNAGLEDTSTEELVLEIDNIANPQHHEQLVRGFIDTQPDYSLSFAISLMTVLLLGADENSEFSVFLRSIFNHYNIELSDGESGLNSEELSPLIDNYLEQLKQIEGAYHEQIEQYLERLLIHSCFKYQYIHEKSLISHVRNIFTLIASMKFLFILHPKTRDICRQLADGEKNGEQVSQLNETMTEVVYLVSRKFDHWNREALALLSSALDEQGINDFDQLVKLARS